MRLAGKLIAIYVLAVIAITCGFSYFTVHRAYRRVESAHTQFARETVERLHARLRQVWLAEGEQGLESFIASVGSSGPVRFKWIWLDQPDGQKYLEQAGEPQQPPLPDRSLLTIRSRSDSSNRLYTYCRLELDNGREGGLEFVSSLDEVDRQTRETIQQAVLMVGMIGLLGLGFVFVSGVRFVARPLEKLVGKMTRVGRGDFSQPVQLKGRDELQQLGNAINEMCIQLERQQQQILEEAQQRASAESQLRHADRLKTVGRLAAGLAHELGTPLGVISGRASMLSSLAATGSQSAQGDADLCPEPESRPEPDACAKVDRKLAADAATEAGAGAASDKNVSSELHPALREAIVQHASSIKQEADRIAAIVRQLLDFARPSPPRHHPTSLVPLCRQTLQLASTLAEDKQIHFHEPTWENSLQAEDFRIPLDPGQMTQVLLNLLVNSIHSIESRGEIWIELARLETEPPPDLASSTALPENCGEYCVVHVRDSGCGISEEHRQQLFEPFFSTKDVGQGTGLGLSVAYGIVREHRGWIEVHSKPGQGSQFSVFLPTGIAAIDPDSDSPRSLS